MLDTKKLSQKLALAIGFPYREEIKTRIVILMMMNLIHALSNEASLDEPNKVVVADVTLSIFVPIICFEIIPYL